MLNMAASGGSPTRTAAPVMLTPLRNLRLLSILPPVRYLRAELAGLFHCLRNSRRSHQRNQQALELEPRRLELVVQLVRWSFSIRRAFPAGRRRIGTSAGRRIPGTRGCRPGSSLTAWRRRNSSSGSPRFRPARRSRAESAAARLARRRLRRRGAGHRNHLLLADTGRWRRNARTRSRSDPSADGRTRTSGSRRARPSAAARPFGFWPSTSGSGSVVMTPGGGGGTCWHSSCSRMKMPRAVGEVSVGPAVDARNVPWPRMPARGASRPETSPSRTDPSAQARRTPRRAPSVRKL